MIVEDGQLFKESFALTAKESKFGSSGLGISEVSRIYFFQEVDLVAPGYAIRVQWAAAYGAQLAEVNPGQLRIQAAVVEEALNDLPVEVKSNSIIVTIPAKKRVRRLTLQKLKLLTGDEFEIVNTGDLPNLDGEATHLAVGWQPTQFVVPQLGSRGGFQPVMTGASYQNRVLTLPDIEGTKISLSLVKGNKPEDFSRQSLSVDKVSGTAAIVSRDLELVDPQGKKLFEFKGEYPVDAGVQIVALSQFVAQSLNDALSTNSPLDFTFRLRGAAPGKAGISQDTIRGVLIRTFSGIVSTNLSGEPALGDPVADPPVITPGEQLATEVPASARADITVRYLGLRILEELSDTLPTGVVSGRVVGEVPVIRNFPPAAFNNIAIARIGLVGRAPEECELSVQVVDWSTGSPGAPLGNPGVITLNASNQVSLNWVEFKNLPPATGAVALLVRANRGRFLWAGETQPLVRIAIADPNPGNRPLLLGGTELLRLRREQLDDQNSLHLPAFALPTAPLRDAMPRLDSPLFLVVDISDLELRYNR